MLSGLQRLELRKDGFGSLASVNSTALASARTVPLQMPVCPAAPGGAPEALNGSSRTKKKQLQLLINAQTSIGGHLLVSLLDESGSVVKGFNQTDAQPFIGNFIGGANTGAHCISAHYIYDSANAHCVDSTMYGCVSI